MTPSVLRGLEAWLQQRSAGGIVTVSVVLVALLGIVDGLTGFEATFAQFYLLPVMVAAFFAGRRPAFAVAVVAAATWGIVDFLNGHAYSHGAILYWNAAARLMIFGIVGTLTAAVSRRLAAERTEARSDFLTGLANRREFHARLAAEQVRASRYRRAFSLVVFDVDDFKAVNDGRGHDAGDALLQTIASTLRKSLRACDTAGRLGGDEFAVLLPEAEADAARAAVQHLCEQLVQAMNHGDYRVGFSMGVVTSVDGSASPEVLMKCADDLAYEAKRAGKGGTRSTVIGKAEAAAHDLPVGSA
ncbi:MAG: GGDEF domain-containing protein [Gammaproteobacteria bacterium]